jgi:SAM-dependent methyltransferase
MSVGTYTYDQAWHDERERLAGIERLWDEGTFALLKRLGVGPGSRVAEVGAGGGSVVEWLSERVGETGRVFAADVYLKFLEPLAGGPVEIAEHDIIAAPLPGGEFDVVHARLLIEHIGMGALGNLLAGVRPGGLLVIEDYDMALPVTSYPPHPDAERVAGAQRVTDAVLDLMASMGHDGECGRKLPSEFEALGLEDVQAEGRVRLIGSGTPDTAFFSLSMETLREALVNSGRARDEEIEERLADLAEPGRTFMSPILVACHGRRAS